MLCGCDCPTLNRILVEHGGQSAFCRYCFSEMVRERDELVGERAGLRAEVKRLQDEVDQKEADAGGWESEARRLKGMIEGLAGRVVAQDARPARCDNMVATEPNGRKRVFVDGQQVQDIPPHEGTM